ncbi:MAG: pilus assembly protein PilM, partial [Planctomycetaceae bacterium]
ALEKVKAYRDQMLSRASQAMHAAHEAAAAGKRGESIRLLQSVPAPLLDESAIRLLGECQAYIDEFSRLSQETQTAIAAQKWLAAGSAIERLMELCPDDQKLPVLASQIASKLLASADRYFSKRRYSDAASCLDAVPANSRSEIYSQLRRKIDNVKWLSQQFDHEPYATPTLGRLAVRLSQQAPDDPQGNQLATQLATCLKESAPPSRGMFPHWKGARKSALGGDASILAWPQRIDCKANEVTRKLPGRFGVAIGLALQGLGEARIDKFLWEKKNLLGAITSRRKSNLCWGIDVGNSGIRAVLLQRDAGRISVSQAYAAEFPPATRADQEGPPTAGMVDAIQTMLQSITLGHAEVIANFSSREVLARFLELPPVSDKKASAMLDAETTRQFPVAVDELSMVRWVAPMPTTESTGRPAAILAAKKTAVASRLETLTQAGLKVTGLQSESIALVNFVAYEFASDWPVGDPAMHTDQSFSSSHSPTSPAIAVIDAGAVSTTLAVIDRVGFWFRLVEGGGEEMTLSLARSTKVVAAEAEKKKRDPAGLAYPVDAYPSIEERQEILAARLKQLIAEPLKQNPQWTIAQTWAVGGACLAHGWMRRVLCKNVAELAQPNH